MKYYVLFSSRTMARSVSILIFTAIICQFTPSEPVATTTLRNVCAFAEKPKAVYNLTYNEKLEHFIQKVINTTGFSGDRIFVSSSPDVEYAASGLRTNGGAEIVVNNKFNPENHSYYNAAFVVHELAHIFNGDIYQDTIYFNNELQADRAAGFWARKNGADVDSIIAYFNKLPEDTSHPPKTNRFQSVRDGWNQANLPYKNPIICATNLSSTFAKYLNLYFTITKTPSNARNKKLYQVYFHLSSKDKSIPFDSIAPKIDRVSYILHEDTFKQPFVTSKNINNDAFGFTLTRVWDTFPIVCIIYFKDDSVFTIVKNFKLID